MLSFTSVIHPSDTDRGGSPFAIIMVAVQLGQLPGRSVIFDPTDGGRTTLFILISEVNALAATAFTSDHTAPVVPEPSFTGFEDTFFRNINTLWF